MRLCSLLTAVSAVRKKRQRQGGNGKGKAPARSASSKIVNLIDDDYAGDKRNTSHKQRSRRTALTRIRLRRRPSLRNTVKGMYVAGKYGTRESILSKTKDERIEITEMAGHAWRESLYEGEKNTEVCEVEETVT